MVSLPLSEREPVVGMATERIQDGAPRGRFFSKKDGPSVPCGQRTRVTGRSARCGRRKGDTLA
jgi:hypothetical protein